MSESSFLFEKSNDGTERTSLIESRYFQAFIFLLGFFSITLSLPIVVLQVIVSFMPLEEQNQEYAQKYQQASAILGAIEAVLTVIYYALDTFIRQPAAERSQLTALRKLFPDIKNDDLLHKIVDKHHFIKHRRRINGTNNNGALSKYHHHYKITPQF